MMRYSIELRDQIFIKVTDFLSFARNMRKNISKNLSRTFNSKYSQKIFDHAKHSATDVLKTGSKIAILKTAEATGNFIGNKIVNKITKVSRRSPQYSSKTVEIETKNAGFDREIPKERYVFI